MKIYKTHLYIASIALVAIGILLVLFLNKGSDKTNDPSTPAPNDTQVVNGVQIINITAKSGGYAPRTIQATSGVTSKLKITSDNSYGCERAFRIPTLGISKTLPTQGVTEIDIPAQDSGKKITGTCSMGMYSFTINFK